MVKARDRANTPGYEVEEIDETINNLLINIDSVARAIEFFTHMVRNNENPDDHEWDWGKAGKLSGALRSLKSVCRMLEIEYNEY